MKRHQTFMAAAFITVIAALSVPTGCVKELPDDGGNSTTDTTDCDYDYEFDNEAELMLKDVDILGDEDENEKELKRCMLRTFNRRLEEREQRKKFVLERGLVRLKTLLAEEKRKTKVGKRGTAERRWSRSCRTG